MKNTTETIHSVRNICQPVAVFCLAFIFGSGWVGATWSAEDVWSRPPFSLAPAELSNAALAVTAPAGTDDIILLDDVKYVFAEDGRHTFSSHLIFRILTPAGAKSSTTVQSSWRMWREEKPQIRARVITPDGVAHPLDPKTIAEAPVDAEQPDVFTDQRVVRAPLPAIDVGSVVEKEVVIPGKTSLLSNGSVHSHYFGNYVPTHRARMTIDAPASMPIHFQTVLMDAVKPRRTESGGRIQLVFEGGPLDPFKKSEPLLPPDVPHWPEITFSTGKSWQDVASHYNEILEQQIRIPEVKTFVDRAGVTGKSRQETIAALLALLQKEIRYTGVEFGDASWIPRTSGETLKRKYGDCKDKASLLVAMLRSAGIPAHLALLTTSTHHETRPELPGLGQFDHAIVYIPASPDLWIDATAEYSRPGELPMADQGRLALVIRPQSTDLIKTPESQSKDNQYREIREFFLAEIGPAKIVETTEIQGAGEDGYRSHYAVTDSKELQKQVKQYGEDTYGALEHSEPKFTNPSDLSQPFRLRIEMPKAARGSSDERESVVVVFPSEIVESLPSLTTETEESEDSGSNSREQKNDKSSQQRKGEILLPEGFVREWRYHIIPPPGFRLRKLPDRAEMKFGHAQYKSEFTSSADGSVSATFRFETGNRRMSAKDAQSFMSGIKELRKTPTLLIYFDQVGEAELADGKIREALQEFKALAVKHPNEALHHTQIARALLQAGIGEAAREEANRAVELEPQSGQPYGVLSTILEHDLVGRVHGKGFDLKGAVAARRKQVELSPDDTAARANLAILLELDENGLRYTPASGVKEAVELYRSLGEKLTDLNVSGNLAISLMKLGRFQEMKEATSLVKEDLLRLTLQIVAAAATQGAKAGLDVAAQSSTTDEVRRAALRSAAATLAGIRIYAPAAELMTAGARGIPEASSELARAELFRKTRRKEEVMIPDSDVRSVFAKQFELLLSPVIPEKGLFDLFPRSTQPPSRRKKMIEEFKKGSLILRNLLTRNQLSLEMMADTLISTLQSAVEGDDKHGHLLLAQAVGGQLEAIFVGGEKKRYFILGINNELDDVGTEIVRLLDHGEQDKARIWLDRARDQLKLAGGDDPLSGRAFPRFWTKGRSGSPEQMRYAAAALQSPGADPVSAIDPLIKGHSTATTDSQRQAFDLALAEAYSKLEKWEELNTVSNRLLEAFPLSITAFTYKSLALRNLKLWEESRKLAEARLKALTEELVALRALRSTAEGQSDFAGAAKYSDRIIATGKAGESDYNSQAWDTLFSETVSDAAVQSAAKAVQIGMNLSFDSLHTLASIHAEMGRVSEAREILLHAMEAAGLEEPDEACWYVFGRIAEQFGELRAAASAYARLNPPEKGDPLPTSTYQLAQRRLKQISGKLNK